MNKSVMAQIAQLEKMLKDNYDNLEVGLKLLRGTPNQRVEMRLIQSQEMLIKTCELVNNVIESVKKDKVEKPIRFNIFDEDFSEQLKKAEDKYVANYGESSSPRNSVSIFRQFESSENKGVSLEILDKDFEEKLKALLESDDNDSEGGTLVGAK